jgi:hypothetical protein
VTRLREFGCVLLIPPPLLIVLTLNELAKRYITFALPDPWAGRVDVGHVPIAHRALNTNLFLRDRILRPVDVWYLLWGEHGRVGTVEGLGWARGLLRGRRRRAWWEDLGLLRVHAGL